MSNCLFFAVALFWRRLLKGKRCYFSMRKSDMGRFPHFLFGEDRRGRERKISYKPINPKHHILPPLLFRGRVSWGDEVPTMKG